MSSKSNSDKVQNLRLIRCFSFSLIYYLVIQEVTESEFEVEALRPEALLLNRGQFPVALTSIDLCVAVSPPKWTWTALPSNFQVTPLQLNNCITSVHQERSKNFDSV